jgi:protein O-mannosyl-transferase
VTLPFVLLLLDYWPLRRFRPPATSNAPSTLWPLVREKLPFFALSIVSGFLAIWAQERGGSLMPLESLSLGSRLANAVVSYARYLGKTMWPADLAMPYPLRTAWPVWAVAGAAFLVAGASLAAVRLARRSPWLFTGWFWFLGTLVPVIGLVQVGNYSLADRFTYLPGIGLFIAGAWGLQHLAAVWPQQRWAGALTGVFFVAACSWRTAGQVQYWQNSETLFSHAIHVTSDNYIAYNNLGTALDRSGQVKPAMECFTQALRIKPDHPEAHINLALAFTRQKQYAAAIAHYQAALQAAPRDAQAQNNLANLLDLAGRAAEAVPHYLAALQAKPDFPEAEYNLADTLAGQGRLQEAAAHFAAALQLKPDFAESHYRLARALLAQNQAEAAISHLREAARLRPNWLPPFNDLAWLLATHPLASIRNGHQAVLLAEKACELTARQQPGPLATLAAAYAEAGQFAQAAATAQSACDLALAASQPDLVAALRRQLALYRSNRPYHEPLPIAPAGNPRNAPLAP